MSISSIKKQYLRNAEMTELVRDVKKHRNEFESLSKEEKDGFVTYYLKYRENDEEHIKSITVGLENNKVPHLIRSRISHWFGIAASWLSLSKYRKRYRESVEKIASADCKVASPSESRWQSAAKVAKVVNTNQQISLSPVLRNPEEEKKQKLAKIADLTERYEELKLQCEEKLNALQENSQMYRDILKKEEIQSELEHLIEAKAASEKKQAELKEASSSYEKQSDHIKTRIVDLGKTLESLDTIQFKREEKTQLYLWQGDKKKHLDSEIAKLQIDIHKILPEVVSFEDLAAVQTIIKDEIAISRKNLSAIDDSINENEKELEAVNKKIEELIEQIKSLQEELEKLPDLGKLTKEALEADDEELEQELAEQSKQLEILRCELKALDPEAFKEDSQEILDESVNILNFANLIDDEQFASMEDEQLLPAEEESVQIPKWITSSKEEQRLPIRFDHNGTPSQDEILQQLTIDNLTGTQSPPDAFKYPKRGMDQAIVALENHSGRVALNFAAYLGEKPEKLKQMILNFTQAYAKIKHLFNEWGEGSKFQKNLHHAFNTKTAASMLIHCPTVIQFLSQMDLATLAKGDRKRLKKLILGETLKDKSPLEKEVYEKLYPMIEDYKKQIERIYRGEESFSIDGEADSMESLAMLNLAMGFGKVGVKVIANPIVAPLIMSVSNSLTKVAVRKILKNINIPKNWDKDDPKLREFQTDIMVFQEALGELLVPLIGSIFSKHKGSLKIYLGIYEDVITHFKVHTAGLIKINKSKEKLEKHQLLKALSKIAPNDYSSFIHFVTGGSAGLHKKQIIKKYSKLTNLLSAIKDNEDIGIGQIDEILAKLGSIKASVIVLQGLANASDSPIPLIKGGIEQLTKLVNDKEHNIDSYEDVLERLQDTVTELKVSVKYASHFPSCAFLEKALRKKAEKRIANALAIIKHIKMQGLDKPEDFDTGIEALIQHVTNAIKPAKDPQEFYQDYINQFDVVEEEIKQIHLGSEKYIELSKKHEALIEKKLQIALKSLDVCSASILGNLQAIAKEVNNDPTERKLFALLVEILVGFELDPHSNLLETVCEKILLPFFDQAFTEPLPIVNG